MFFRSIISRLYFLYALGCLLLIAVTAGVIYSLDTLRSKENAHFDLYHEIEEESLKIQLGFKTQIQEWKNVLIRGHDPELYQKYFQSFERNEKEVAAETAELITLLKGLPVLKEKAVAFEAAHQQMSVAYREALKFYDPAVPNPHRVTDAMVRGIDRAPILLLQDVVEGIDAYNQEQTKIIEEEFLFFELMIFAAVVLMSVFVSAVFIFILRRGISKPVQILTGHVHCLVEGEKDLTQRVSTDHVSEMAAIARGVNNFIADVQGLMKSIKSSSSSLCSVANQSAKSNIEINNIIRDQQHSINSIGEEIANMSDTIGMIANSAQLTVETANDASKVTQEGDQKVEQVISALQSLVDEVSTTSSAVQRMSESSAQVNSILKFIGEITEKINLLALNAAIEAARAGEHGRGFAVVADEVRSLATQTNSATGEIAKVIESIQASVGDSLTAIESSSRQADVTIGLAREAGQSLQVVREATAGIAVENQQVAEASSLRANEARGITERISAINATILNTVNKVDKDTSDIADLAQISALLDSLIGQFKVDDSQPAKKPNVAAQAPVAAAADKEDDDLVLF